MIPATAMNWAAFDANKLPIDTTVDVTPPAASALLSAVNAVVQAVAVTPYVACGHLTWKHYADGQTPDGNQTQYYSLAVAPGAVHARASIWDRVKPNLIIDQIVHQAWTATGGSAGANVAIIPMAYGIGNNGATSNGPSFLSGVDKLTESSQTINDAPAATTNRMLELPSVRVSQVEDGYLSYVQSWSIRVTHTTLDLASL